MAGTLRRRVRMLESMTESIKLLRLHMISMFEPVQYALRSSGCNLLESIGEQMTPGVSAAEAWGKIRCSERKRGGMVDALAPEDLEVLDALFDRLGESGRDQQEIMLNGISGTLGRNLEAARRRTAEADRLYVSLGALSGLMIALIVI